MLEKVLTGKLTFTASQPCDLSETNRSEIKAYFENSYDLNDSLFTALKDESVFYKCPDRLRLPLIFYYAHTACVYVNKLILGNLIQPRDRINFEFDTLFETGVDENSWDDTENYRMGGKFQWPSLDDAVAYRRKIRHLVLEVIEKTPLELPITMESPWWAVMMGIEHERIHLETSSVLIRQLPANMVVKPDGFVYGPLKAKVPVSENTLVSVPACNTSLGKQLNFPSFGWDNEYGFLKCRVPAFSASKYMISNGEFYKFIEDGGYHKENLWTNEGWEWKEYYNVAHPSFWVCDKGCKSKCGDSLSGYSHCESDDANISNGYPQDTKVNNYPQYSQRCMFDVMDMAWDWPVEVTYHEAKAYCAWKGSGYRLPSEAEHNVMRGDMSESQDDVECEPIYQRNITHNLNIKHGSSTPVNMYPPTSLGFYDVSGNVWEWTEDHLYGFTGFKTCPLYDDYSHPSFDGQHNIMLGGSWASTGSGASRFARYGFRRHFMQFCGFRVAISKESPVSNGVSVECSQHDNDAKDDVLYSNIEREYLDETYTSTIMEKIIEWLERHANSKRRFLHLGCGSGHLSFKLAELCTELLAIDMNQKFVDFCAELQSKRSITLQTKNKTHEVQAPGKNNANVTFKMLNWLPNEVGFFDVAVSTFFDRVPNVDAWTLRLREIVRDGGLLIIASASICEDQTLRPVLGKSFILLDTTDIPLTGGTLSMSLWKHH